MSQTSFRQTTHRVLPANTRAANRGLEAIYEFNGLRINDLRQLDTYRLLSISGLDDSDIRDSREPNADSDGETPFGALHGGRTIILRGRVEAGNLEYMRYMWDRLAAAFDDVTIERPLHICWLDHYDDFDGDSSDHVLQDYGVDAGAGTFGFSGTPMAFVPTSTALKSFYYKHRRYIDHETTVEFSTGASVASYVIQVGKRVSGSVFLGSGIGSGPIMGTQLNGAGGYLDSVASVTLSPNTRYWLRARQEGNIVSVSVYTADPDLGGAPINDATVYTTLSGANATALGTGVVGDSMIRFTPGGTDWRLWSVDTRAANPGDMMIMCKKAAKLEGDESFDGFLYRRPFMITLRASGSKKLSRTVSRLSASVGSGAVTFPAGGAGIPFDANGSIVFGTALGSVVNLGYAETWADLRLTGPLTNPSVINMTNGNRVTIEGTIASGDYVDINSTKRTIVDKAGKNRYDLLGSENTWMRLEAGANQLASGADVVGGTVTIIWRHAFR